MQQNPQGRRFADSQPQPPVYRFPQNQPAHNGANPTAYSEYAHHEPVPMSKREQRAARRAHKGKHRKIFTLWNLFAVIGIISVILQIVRYAVIPFLVYLNSLTGGAL